MKGFGRSVVSSIDRNKLTAIDIVFKVKWIGADKQKGIKEAQLRKSFLKCYKQTYRVGYFSDILIQVLWFTILIPELYFQ